MATMKTKYDLFIILNQLNVDYRNYQHPAIYTTEDAKKIAIDIPGIHCKNLFLQDTKENVYLLVANAEKNVNLKSLSKIINSSRLSFVSAELLYQILGVLPGSVSPLALINDVEQKATVLLDKNIIGSSCVNFHPLDNTMTTAITADNLLKFINYCGNKIIVV
ncbi:MAG: prolyl-tRNA synthetase associated domain-containing protein [Gammaproteobacteria bacterium]|nr:MAG: prolyl-tRNA synthetase associated domain-containing protein [Gammaproteobacteria bacterium]